MKLDTALDTGAHAESSPTRIKLKTILPSEPESPQLLSVHPSDEPVCLRLIEAAKEASRRAYCPYSNFNVGAAVLAFDGQIYLGCNIENASLTQTKHAEEVALSNAVADGVILRAKAQGLTQFQAILAVAVFVPKGSDPWPCCNCRQSLSEFGFDMLILGEDSEAGIVCLTLGQLIPKRFPLEEVLKSVRGG
jgi:cytidine deaminase